MHVAFVHSHYESLGIEYISSVLKIGGHKTSLIFEPALFHNFFFNKQSLYNVFNFNNYILKRIKEINPDIVAFSVISDNYSWSSDMAKQIKEISKAKVVFGGVHPTSVPEYVLKDGVADYIVIGEGEYAFLDLVNAIQDGRDISSIHNIGTYERGKFYLNSPRCPIPDLDLLPFPDKDLFYKECKIMAAESYMIMGSRGCNNNCSYCWNSVINKVYRGMSYFRRRTPANVTEELKWAQRLYKIKKVTFYDEVFTSDKIWLKKFLQLYRDNIKLPFFCCVHPDDVDEEIVDLLSGAGCSALNIGVQTANENTRLQVLNRRGSNEQIIRALRLLRNTKIFVYSNIILGLPNEGENDLIATLEFCNKHRADLPSIYWLRYYPMTRMVDVARDAGVLTYAEVEKINEGKDYSPYAISGSTYKKDFSRLGNLILLSGVMPYRLINFSVRHRLYNYMISENLLFPVILCVGWLKRLFNGKRHPFHYLDLFGYLKFYLFYINKKIYHLLTAGKNKCCRIS